MRDTKKHLLGASAFAMTLALSNVAVPLVTAPVAFAAEEAQGAWGSCQWQLYADGTLRIGQGEGSPASANVLDTFYNADGVEYRAWNTRTVSPWREYASQITAVRFEGDVILPPDCSYLFEGCSSLKSLQLANTDLSKLTIAKGMFKGCSALESVDLTSWACPQNVNDMSNMFKDCSALTSVNLTYWDTVNVQDMSGMFDGCSKLTDIVILSPQNRYWWKTTNVKNMTAMFKGCASLKSLDLWTTNWDTSNVSQATKMFEGCALDEFTVSRSYKILSADMVPASSASDGKWWSYNDQQQYTKADIVKRSNVEDKYSAVVPEYSNINSYTDGKWGSCDWELLADGTLKVHYGTGTANDKSPWDAHKDKVKSIVFDEGVKLPANSANIFSGLTALTSVSLKGAETSSVTSLAGMFRDCKALTTIDLSTWNVSKVKNMSDMFSGCKALTTLITTNWATSRVQNMSGMFRDCTSLVSLDLKHFNTASLQDMSLMFKGCTSLATLNLSGWDTKNVSTVPVQYTDGTGTHIGYAAFEGCESLAEFAVGENYGTNGSAELIPKPTATDEKWFSTHDGKRYTSGEIVSARAKNPVADTYTSSDKGKQEAPATTPTITADHSMTLESMITLNFFADISSLPADQLDSVNMVFKVADGTTRTVSYKESVKTEDGLQMFGCPLNSLQIADKVTATLNWKGGSVTANPYSLADYMAKYNDVNGGKPEKALMTALVHATQDYGHYAQDYLSDGNLAGNAAMPFNAEITTAMQNEAKRAVDANKLDTSGVPSTWKVALTLSLNSGVDLNAKFTLPSGVSYESATIDGKQCTAIQQDGRWVVTVPSIAAHQLAKSHAIVLKAGGNTATLNVSALTWVREALNTTSFAPGTKGGACAAAIYRYSQAAEAVAAGK